MDLKDIFITPIFLILFYIAAFFIRPKITNKITKKYFLPALSIKFLGAISLGLVYQFYYSGGDTTNYFNLSKIVHAAFIDDFFKGIQLIMANGEFNADILEYSSKIYWYTSPPEYLIVKVATIFGLLNGHTYSVIALHFAFFSFLGCWAMFNTFLKMYPKLSKEFAYAIFYLPSVFFWGSGLMKDSLTLGALGFIFWSAYKLFIEKKISLITIVIGLIAGWLIFIVKIYILLCFLPPIIFWIFNENSTRIKNYVFKLIAKPIFLLLGIVAAYIGTTSITSGNKQYNISNLGKSTKITQEYLSEYVTSGSIYHIGTLDGSLLSILKLAPQAINVALFRPYLWEVSNPIMLLSAIEATFFMLLTLFIFLKIGILNTFRFIGQTPILQFCFIFSIVFAIGVGTSSGNFGTLVRYKIPLLPFYLSALFIMYDKIKSKKILMRKKPSTLNPSLTKFPNMMQG